MVVRDIRLSTYEEWKRLTFLKTPSSCYKTIRSGEVTIGLLTRYLFVLSALIMFYAKCRKCGAERSCKINGTMLIQVETIV